MQEKINESIMYLQRLGLNVYQSRALAVLLAKNIMTAREICQFSEVPHTKIYEVLSTLRDKGLIDHTMAKPRCYEIPGTSAVLNKLIMKEVKRVESLKNEKEMHVRALKEIEFISTEKKVAHMHPVFSATVGV